ncbi:unnamed protein product, partial [Penicillium discolor]
RLPQPGIRGEVERGEGVVEHEHLRPVHDGPRDRQALALTAGHVRAALGDAGVETVRHLLHEVATLGDLQRVPEFLVGGVLAAVAQVGRDGAGEEEGTLRHQTDAVPQRLDVGLADVYAADVHGPAGHVEQARDERDERGLARPGGADDRDGLPRLRGEADAGEDGGVGAGVRELHVIERDRARGRESGDAVHRAGHGGLRVQHFADALGGNRGARDHHRHEARHDDAAHDLADVLHEGEQGAHLHGAVVDLDAAEPDDGDHGHVEDEHEQREEQHEQGADLAADDHDVGVRAAEALLLDALPDEGPHDPHARELLAHDAVHVVELALVAAEERDHPADDECREKEQHRDGDGDQPAQSRVGLHGEDDAADREQRRGDEHGRAHHRQHLHLLHVVRVAGDEGSGAELRDLALGEAADLAEHVGADVTAGAHRGAGGEEGRDDRGHDLAERHGQHEQAGAPDVRGVALCDAVVDDVGIEARQVEGGGRAGELEDQHGDEEPLVA